jgi:divalent metal cation (Fe/Co/Zn/Cd) transporter
VGAGRVTRHCTGATASSSGDRRDAAEEGTALEVATLAWNVVGIGVLSLTVVLARSVALGGFALDSLIEIGASLVVLWELADSGESRQRRALRIIRGAFVALAVYLTAQSVVVVASGFNPRHSPLGIAWTAITAAVMFALAAGKRRAGQLLHNPVLITEGRVTTIDGLLACAVLIGITLNAVFGYWWADPAAGFVIVYYALREAGSIHRDLTA